MEENEGLEVGTESSESTESQSAASNEGQPEQSAQAAAPKPDETPIDWDKAFKHERFKELIDQKNAAINSTRALELKLAQLEGRLQSQPSPQAKAEKDDLIEDIKNIDPRLAARLEAFGNSSKTIEQMQAKLDQFEKSQQQSSQKQIAEQSVSKINSWHDTNKVPDAIKAAINAQLDVQYMQGKLNPQNLEAQYKAAYEPYKAFIEQTQREALKSYVPGKKADANTPTSQPKGTPASKPAKAPEKQFKDREELRAHVAKEFVRNQAAKREASSV